MDLTEQEQITLDTYEAHAEDWTSSHHKRHFWEEAMSIFYQHLPYGKVLEIGAGSGRDAQNLIDLGYSYIGTVISKSFLKIARRENPDQIFFHQSVYDLDFPEGTFDGFWASAVLLHDPKSRINEALSRIKICVKKGGEVLYH